MRAIRDGEHPPAPIHETLDFALAEVDEDRTRIILTAP